MMSHGNLLTCLISIIPRFGERSSKDELYVSYLPSAHVLELCSQIGWLIKGIGLGYSSPFTLTDNSTAIKEGDLGDLSVLKPTFMIAVPIVLERIKKAVEEKMARQNVLLRSLFECAFDMRLRKAKLGRSSLLIDRLLFNKIKAVLGGRLETLLVGGSILNPDVHEFGQACFCRVIQAYGLFYIIFIINFDLITPNLLYRPYKHFKCLNLILTFNFRPKFVCWFYCY